MLTAKVRHTAQCSITNKTPFCAVLHKMHAQGLFTHMPFVVSADILLFSVGLKNARFPNKDWRIGYIDARTQTWRLFDTQLPAETIECSPTAHVDKTTNKIAVWFLASTPDRPTYCLYSLSGYAWDQLTPAKFSGVATYHGFVNDSLFVTSQFVSNNDICIHIKKRTGQVDTLVALNQYVHKVSYLAQQPQKILVSLQKKENPRHAKELLIDTDDYSRVQVIKSSKHKLYKASLYDDMLLYGKKLSGFDERQICATTAPVFVEEPLRLHLAKTPTQNGQTLFSVRRGR